MAELKATQRNRLLGLLADKLDSVAEFLSTSTNPVQDTGADLSLAGLLGQAIKPFAVTADRLSYGEPLTTGQGMTRQMRPETREVALALSPAGLGTKAVGRGAVATGKAISPQVEKTLMDFMRQQGGIKEITAYHGTPHLFDKFSLDKIGTGEGAQVYGRGLYFADNPAVAQQYQKELSKTGDLIDGKPIMELYEKIQNRADRLPINKAQVEYEKLNFLEDLEQQSSFADALSRIDDPEVVEWAKTLQGRWQPAGNLYKVDIPDEAVAKMLDWDAPLGQQNQFVKDKLSSLDVIKNLAEARTKDQTKGLSETGIKNFMERTGGGFTPDKLKGQDIYQGLYTANQGNDAAVAELLRQIGIPGIRYLDQGSRFSNGGTKNTVLFDDSLVKILERNGIPMQGLLD